MIDFDDTPLALRALQCCLILDEWMDGWKGGVAGKNTFWKRAPKRRRRKTMAKISMTVWTDTPIDR
eukprot:355714-Chlamydomonas_euryale.AAC.2